MLAEREESTGIERLDWVGRVMLSEEDEVEGGSAMLYEMLMLLLVFMLARPDCRCRGGRKISYC